MKKICLTVTNDLSYDQRMIRICTSLSAAGFEVTLVGRKLKNSRPLINHSFHQKRLRCFFNSGFLFYAEYNLRLFFFLLFKNFDALCAIDLDTILPCLLVSGLQKIPRVYDAHEYFTEMKEVRSRPGVQKFWLAVERFCLPRFDNGYTVSEGLAIEFEKQYHRHYEVIRNLPVLKPLDDKIKTENFILFQGAVNEARGFEYLVPAMKDIPYSLVICGDGNYMTQLKKLIRENKVEDKVVLKGMMLPEEMWPIAQKAAIGLGLAEKEGINQYHALPNKFTDYMHAGLPQIAMAFPEYRKINDQYRIALLLDQLSVDVVVRAINALMRDETLREDFHLNALKAREIYCWQNEEKKLVAFYKKLLSVE